MSEWLTRRALVLAVLGLLTACAPIRSIKPLPAFVMAGVVPGDTVKVVTRDGELHRFVVQEVTPTALLSDTTTYLLTDLASIEKRAWSRPASPCGGDEPLGCSVPWLVMLASESHSHYTNVFYDACAEHDYCYRHGAATYGHGRDDCDEAFLADMRALCPDPPRGILSAVKAAINDSVASRQTCLSVASDYHWAVRSYGDGRFLTSNSTYCEYNGPPSGAAPEQEDQ